MRQIRIMASATQRRFLQAILEDDEAEIVGFGGARGGGKTWASAMAMVLRRLKYAGTRGLMLRRTQGAADQNLGEEIEKVCRQLRLPRGMVKKRVRDNEYHFPNGSYIALRYCRLGEDWQIQQGIEYTDIAFEEATQFPESDWNNIGGSNRSLVCRAKRWLTCNPGGIGHLWVEKRIINPETRDRRVVWVPSKLRDSPAILEYDPGYALRVLRPLPEWQRLQWEDGDWNAIAGQYWQIGPHVARSRDVPYWAKWYAGVDWGKAKPFAVVWVGMWEDWHGRPHAHVAAEIRQAGLDYDEQAEAVALKEEELRARRIMVGEDPLYYADPSTDNEFPNESKANTRTVRQAWAKFDFVTTPARRHNRVGGWQLIKLLMRRGILTIEPTCMGLLTELRTAISHGAPGPPKSEDMDPLCEDHSMDALRYCVRSIFPMDFTGPDQDPYGDEQEAEVGDGCRVSGVGEDG